MNTKMQENMEAEYSNSLHEQLVEGIKSMKSGDVYTIEEAWQEIDQL